MEKRFGKKASEILTENVVYIILTIVFFSMLLIFIYIQSSSNFLLSQKTAKQIALMIDASDSGTEISLALDSVLNKALKNGISNPVIIDDENNKVIIQIDDKNRYEYGFFNDLQINYVVTGGQLLLKIG